MVHALVSQRVVTPEGLRPAAVLIQDETIAAVLPPDALDPAIPREDLGSLALLPGLVDLHAHLNEPGRTEWEGFFTGTRAAAAGGFTTLLDMPLNCLPETTNPAALHAKRNAIAGKATVDYGLWGGAVDGNQHQLEPLAEAGVRGFKSFLIYPGCDGFTAIDLANLARAIPSIARTGLPLLVHAELAGPIEAALARLNRQNADWRRYSTWLASRPDQAELDAIQALLALCRQTPFHLHIVHLATAQALPLLAAARAEGLPVTVETCPHYLHAAAAELETLTGNATLWKCAPPIRSRADREALWHALQTGVLDCIATDHSPCPPSMKRLDLTPEQIAHGQQAGRFDEAWGGIASLGCALSVVWTGCTARHIPLSDLVRWMSTTPARIAGLANRIGAIAPGLHANLVAFDPDATFTLTPADLHDRHRLTPYLGETLRGRVHTTWLRGRTVFSQGTFPTPPFGQEYTA